MSQPPARRSGFVPTAELLPPPPLARSLLLAGLAALLGAAAWGLLVYFARIEHGVLAWGIGAFVGFAVVKAGGHGMLLAACAGVLALLSIGSGKHLGFQLFVGEQAGKLIAEVDETHHAERGKDAADWVALGAQPTPEQVQQFADGHGYDVDDPQLFAHEFGPGLKRFAEEKPDLATWREQLREEVTAEASFADYLQEDFHPADVLFVLLGIGSAFGLVSRATARLQVAARQAARAEREEASAGEGGAGTA